MLNCGLQVVLWSAWSSHDWNVLGSLPETTYAPSDVNTMLDGVITIPDENFVVLLNKTIIE